MKTISFLKFAMAAALVAFVSCQKENTDPEPEPDPISEPPAFVCEHNTLEYVEAVKRTATAMGNNEHWHCNVCNRNFLDAETTREVKDAYLCATNYSIDPELLNRIKNIYPFVPASGQTKGDDKGLIPSAVTNLYHKVQEYEFKTFSKALFTELNEINEQLALIESQVEEIQKQNIAIRMKVEDTPYCVDVDEIFNRGRFIWETSLDCFDSVVECYGKFNDGKISEDELKTQIRKICLQWNANEFAGESIYDLTTRAIQQFSGCHIGVGEEMTYPQVFHKFNSYYRLWDHDGYTDRKQMDIESEAVLSLGYFMASLYRDNAKLYAYEPARQMDSLLLCGYYGNIEPLVETDIENMRMAYEEYRCFHDQTTRIYIEKSPCFVISDDYTEQLTGYHQPTILWRDPVSVGDEYKQLNRVLDQKYPFGWTQGTTMTAEDYTAILKDYPNGNIFNIMRDNAAIADMPQYHEQLNVYGAVRTSYMRYFSNNDNTYSYSDDLCSTYSHRCYYKYMKWCYREFYASNHGDCGHSGETNVTNIYAQEMLENGTRGDNMELAFYIRNWGWGSKNSPPQALHYSLGGDDTGKADGWRTSSTVQVFLKKYAGTIYDE